MITFIVLVFMWLMPLPATPGQNHNLTSATDELSRNISTQGHLITQESSTLNPLSEEKNTKLSSKHYQQQIQTTPSETLSVDQKTATPLKSITSPLHDSTVGVNFSRAIQIATSSKMLVTHQASTRVISLMSSSTQSQDTGKTSTAEMSSIKMTNPPTRSTQLFSTVTTSMKPVDKSTRISPVTGGGMHSTRLYKTALISTEAPFVQKTTTMKRKDPKGGQDKKGENHSKVVAGIIGGTLILMFVGFLIIFVKKQKLQKQQITTTDWAGPSPFLSSGPDNNSVTIRSSNQISLSSFLPQRMSKRLSLLQETDEELEDIPGTTFGNKHKVNTFEQEVDENESNVAVISMKIATGDVPNTDENSGSVTSSQTNDMRPKNNNPEDVNLSQSSANASTPELSTV